MLKRFKEFFVGKVLGAFGQTKLGTVIYYLNILFDIVSKIKDQDLGDGCDRGTILSKHQIINLCNARDMARDSKRPINKRIDVMIKIFFSALIVSSLAFVIFDKYLNYDAKTLLSSIIGFCYEMIKCIVIFEVGGGISSNETEGPGKKL